MVFWLFVGQLDDQTEALDLRNYFREWGDVCEWMVAVDCFHRSRRFGYVAFDSGRTVDEIQVCRPHYILDREVLTRRSLGPDAEKEKYLAFEEPPVGLQVWGYLPDTPVRLLRNIFSSYGAVTDLRLSNYVAEDQVRYGWLYVAFNDYDPVDYLTLMPVFDIGSAVCHMVPCISSEANLPKSSSGYNHDATINIGLLRQNTELENRMMRSTSVKDDIDPKTGQSRKRKRKNTSGSYVTHVAKRSKSATALDRKTAQERDGRIHDALQAFIFLKSAPKMIKELEDQVVTAGKREAVIKFKLTESGNDSTDDQLQFAQKMQKEEEANLTDLKALVEKTKVEQTCRICTKKQHSHVFSCGHGACQSCLKGLRHCCVCKELISHKLVLAL